MGHRDRAVIALACVSLYAARAHADPPARDGSNTAPAAVALDRLLPIGVAAPSDGVTATSTAGYVDAPAFAEAITGTMGRFSVNVAAFTLGGARSWRAEAGVAFGIVRSHALDLDLGAAYEPVGWSGVPELVSRVAIGRAILGGRVQATAAIGVNQPGERSERYGDFDLAATHPVGWGFHAGVDARYRLDLAQDPDDAPTERQWDAQLAAFAAHAIGRFAVVASAGYAGWKLRFGTANAGALATLGLAAQFW